MANSFIGPRRGLGDLNVDPEEINRVLQQLLQQQQQQSVINTQPQQFPVIHGPEPQVQGEFGPKTFFNRTIGELPLNPSDYEAMRQSEMSRAGLQTAQAQASLQQQIANPSPNVGARQAAPERQPQQFDPLAGVQVEAPGVNIGQGSVSQQVPNVPAPRPEIPPPPGVAGSAAENIGRNVRGFAQGLGSPFRAVRNIGSELIGGFQEGFNPPEDQINLAPTPEPAGPQTQVFRGGPTQEINTNPNLNQQGGGANDVGSIMESLVAQNPMLRADAGAYASTLGNILDMQMAQQREAGENARASERNMIEMAKTLLNTQAMQFGSKLNFLGNRDVMQLRETLLRNPTPGQLAVWQAIQEMGGGGQPEGGGPQQVGRFQVEGF